MPAEFDLEKIKVKFLIGNNPKPSDGTLVKIEQNNKTLSKTRWDLGKASNFIIINNYQ